MRPEGQFGAETLRIGDRPNVAVRRQVFAVLPAQEPCNFLGVCWSHELVTGAADDCRPNRLLADPPESRPKIEIVYLPGETMCAARGDRRVENDA